ncbi:MAG: DUF3558 domain-containing protein [Lysobacter sp.]|nr:DUF3558 domain-containing protein [Lysobacter sp.]
MRLPIRDRPVRFAAIFLVAICMAACAKPPPGDAASTADAETSSATRAAEDDVGPADPDSPCRLLSDTEVRTVFAGASPGERETTREQYGISACVWQTPASRLMVQTWAAKEASAEEEIRGLTAGFVDPLNRAAADNVRLETITGIGEEAFAVVETRDAQRGILNDAAMLVARHDGRILVLMSDELTRSDRAHAIAALQALGRSAVGRL